MNKKHGTAPDRAEMYPRIINQFIDNYHSLWRAATCRAGYGTVERSTRALCPNALLTVGIPVARFSQFTLAFFFSFVRPGNGIHIGLKLPTHYRIDRLSIRYILRAVTHITMCLYRLITQ